MSELNPIYDAADAQFLMSLVDKQDSDYNDGVDGYPNYEIAVDEATGVPTLRVEFQDAQTGEVLSGEWRLSLVSVSRTGGAEDE